MQLEVTITHRFAIPDSVLQIFSAMAAQLVAPGNVLTVPNTSLDAPAAADSVTTVPEVVTAPRARKPRASKADAGLPAAPVAPSAPALPPVAPGGVAPTGATGVPSSTPGFDTAGFPLPGHNQHGLKVEQYHTPAQREGMTPAAPAATGWAKPAAPAAQPAARPVHPALAPPAQPLAAQATLKDVSEAFSDLIYSEKLADAEQRAMGVLSKHGVDNVMALKPEQYGAVVSELKAELYRPAA